LIGGQVQMTFSSPGQVSSHIRSGKLRALAVTNEQPSALFPDLPTVAAAGVPGYDAGATSGIFAPAKTPAGVINRLSQEIMKVVSKADVKEKFLNSGVETVGTSPEEFAAKIKSEMTKLGKVIKDAGIRAE
jgi:tripartite-type tricarboxylate transporter receptor subunit TctC